ncbi:putative 3-methyladenine DNA glycosylase [Saccoglossus kowalevskii]|uniref:DNA-3-methyladenine glycosylase II n=1 Tax=Saccoglossus kowalevskii TaxID=10224 RepID=A0ABM0GPS5_SACKO|nr:PREDICTED: DNA-3-methyladenine glycosylase-like [Saccoglossus kowalevskii]
MRSKRGKRSASSKSTSTPAKIPKTTVSENKNETTETKLAVKSTDSRLMKEYYKKSCVDLARDLLGKILVRKTEDGERLAGKIVETEAYLGGEDKGAHSYGGKKTEKNAAMFMDPGTCYVYYVYGLYSCVNISSQGEGAAVLIRALDPVNGLAAMHISRSQKRKKESKPFKDHELCNGPSKLCQAMRIDKKNFNCKDLTTIDEMWVEKGVDVDASEIIECPRIGIDYAKEWATKPLRFYIKGNKNVSVKNKEVEKGN